MTRRAFAPLLCVLAFACGTHEDVGDGSSTAPDGGSSSGGGTSSGGGSSGGNGAQGTGSSSGGVTATPVTPQTVCNALLACAEAQSPSQLGSYQPEYGSTGTCWQMYSAAACGASCQQAINLLTEPNIPACTFCSSSSDCMGRTCYEDIIAPVGENPAQGCTQCKPDANFCVACLTDADCTNGFVCSTEDPTYPGCVQCLKDADCKDPARPRCNTSAQQCQACLTNADCTSPSTPVCASDGVVTACFQCDVDSDCATNPSGHRCLNDYCQCDTADDCAAGEACIPPFPDAGGYYGKCGSADGGV